VVMERRREGVGEEVARQHEPNRDIPEDGQHECLSQPENQGQRESCEVIRIPQRRRWIAGRP
jgi:hypothetical protein